MMKIPTLLTVLIGAVALAVKPSQAQDTPQPVPELLASPTREVPLPGPAPTPCAKDCAPRPGYKPLWVEREVPIQRIIPREVITLVPTTTIEVAYREEKRVITEMVIKPREVERPVTSCTLKPVTVTCSTTGECRTVMQPCTEVKMVKVTEFVAVPEKRELIEKVPFLRTVEIQVPQKTLILEYKTEMKKVGGVVTVPCVQEVLPRRVLLAPPAPCDASVPVGQSEKAEQPAR